MNITSIFFALITGLLLLGGIWLFNSGQVPPFSDQSDGVMCTMEALECPDGSYVGRSGPNCEFAACPDMPPAPPDTAPILPPVTVPDTPVSNDDDMVMCTMDARECSDGSFVGRVAPNCDFAACSNAVSTSSEPILPPDTPVSNLEEDRFSGICAYNLNGRVVQAECGVLIITNLYSLRKTQLIDVLDYASLLGGNIEEYSADSILIKIYFPVDADLPVLLADINSKFKSNDYYLRIALNQVLSLDLEGL